MKEQITKPIDRIAFSLILIACLLLPFSGCKSVQIHRARQYSSDWRLLNAATQERVTNAQIRRKDSTKIVYIALGTPQYTHTKNNTFTWIYFGTFGDIEVLSSLTEEEILPPFYTRAETRISKQNEKRFQLHLHFTNDILTNWELKPIDDKITQRVKQYPLGTYPKPPSGR